MKKLFLIFLAGIVTSLHTQADRPSQFNRNTVELVMKKLSINPSRSLCFDLGQHKCESGCCQDTQEYIKLRQFAEGEVKEGEQVFKTEKELCDLTQRKYCGNTCCMKGDCYFPQKQEGNLKLDDLQCTEEDPSPEELCRGVGLLWCDGECCGFSSSKHKCFSKNHFGTPYIRCPIEAEPAQL